MAANGTITLTSANFASGDGVQIKIKYTEQNINVSARTSDVRFHDATMEVRGVDAGTYASILLKANGEAIIDAKDYRGDFGAFMVPGVPTVINYTGGTWPKTITVRHNDDGTKSIPVTATGMVVSNNSWQHGWTIPDYSATIQLETIAVASTFTVSGTTIGSAMTFAIARASSGFTHKLYYKHGSDAYALIADSVGTSYTWNIPESIGGKIPSANSGTFTLKVDTYNGSTLLGSNTRDVTLTVPSYSLTGSGWYSAGYTNTGTAAAGINKPVKGYSKLTYSVTSSGVTTRYGATLNAPTVTVNGVTPQSGQTLMETSTTVTFRISDSRGKSLEKSVTVSALDYNSPSILNAEAKRCDSTGDEDDEGMFWYARAAASVSSLDGANSYTLTAAIKSAGGSYGTENALTSGQKSVFGGTLSPVASYVVRFTLTDALGSRARIEATIQTMEVTFNAKRGGRGFAFGKPSEYDDMLEVDWNLRTNKYLGYRAIEREDIPGGANADDYWTPGHYRCRQDEIAVTISNLPTGHAFILDVYSGIGQDELEPNLRAWMYITQRIETYRGEVFLREGMTSSTTTMTWGDWIQVIGRSCVIEQGTSNGWQYRKWSDGTLEEWKTETVSTTIASAWGSLYESGAFYANYASAPAFIARPNCQITINALSYAAMLEYGGNGSATRTPAYYFIRTAAMTTARDYEVYIYAIGRWK